MTPDKLPEAIAKMTDGHGVDIVIITASTKGNGPVELGAEIARRKGRVVVVGAVGMNLPRPPFYEKELELRLSMSYGPGRYDADYEEKGRDYPYGYVRWTERRNMAAFLDLVAAGKVDVKRLTTHSYAIEEAEAAYDMIMEGSEPSLGVVLTYRAPETEAAAPAPARLTLSPRKSDGKTRLGIIGAGNHVKGALLPALSAIKDADLVAVCTQKGVNAKNLAEKIGAAFCTTDYREILSDDTIDGVIIGTRHDTHAEIVMAALDANKHVFVEKPLCLTAAELEEISITYAGKATLGLQFMVGFNRSFSAHMEKAKEVFAGRREPLVMHYRVNAGAVPAEHWVQDPEVGGGRIIGEACHFVDYLQELAGSEITAVQATSIGHHSSGITDDQASLMLSFADGSIGSIVYAAAGDRGLAKERCEVFGAGVALVMDDFLQTDIYRRGRKEVFKTRKRDKGFQQQMTAFLDAVKGEASLAMTFDDIDRVTRTCFLALESMRSGERLKL
jgi:predicted dehydrogenase